MFMGIWI